MEPDFEFRARTPSESDDEACIVEPVRIIESPTNSTDSNTEQKAEQITFASLQLKLQHFRRLRDDVKKARQEAIASFEAQYPSNVSPSPLADSHVAPALSTEYSAAAQQLRRRQMASSLALARQVDVGRSLVKQAKNAYQLLLKRRNHRKLLLETVRQTSILLCDAATIASSVDGAMSRTGVRAA